MSFLNISDLEKREQMVKEYLATKKKIRDSQLAEKTGEIELQQDLSKFFKPITDVQKETATRITEGLKPIKEGIEQLPQLPQALPEALPEELLSSLFDKNFSTATATYGDELDKTFGIKKRGNNYFMGDRLVDFDGKYYWIGADKFEATPGLENLIFSSAPDPKIYDKEDLVNHAKMVDLTDVAYRHNNRLNPPKSSGGLKYKNYIKPVVDRVKKRTGKGITVILPSDPNALLERLDLLIASKEAGNTGLRNEMVSICDELKRQEIVGNETYKSLILHCCI